jgi:predicted DNA-binding protein YlxM (UPF0122 family)
MSVQKRLALTLPDDLDSLITEIAELREIKKTRVVSELLKECQPQLVVIRDALKSIKNNEKPNTEDILLKLLGGSFENLSKALKGLEND